MAAQRKYDQEFRDRGVRMYRERLEQRPDESKIAARRHVGDLLGVNAATLRNWVEAGERAEGTRGPAPARAVESEELKAGTAARSGDRLGHAA